MSTQRTSPGVTCPSCGGPSTHRNGKPIRCQACAVVTLKCATCGQTFQRAGADHDKHMRRNAGYGPFCSAKCINNNPPAITRECATCGRTFRPRSQAETRRHCSPACAATARRLAPRKNPPKSCEWCGVAFAPVPAAQKFCGLTCKNAAHAAKVSGDGNPNFLDQPGRGGYAFRMKPLILLRDKRTCAGCGEAARHVHHINEMVEDNRQDNLISLCEACHNTLHKSNQVPSHLSARTLEIRAVTAATFMTSKWWETVISLRMEYSSTTA